MTRGRRGTAEQVVNAMHHATVSRFPAERYMVGFDSCNIFIPLSWLPTSVSNRILLLAAGKPVLPKACRNL
jgi:hypothetical protein